MKSIKKLKTVEVDDRGRITLPKTLREDVHSYSLERLKDGTIKLVPHKSVPLSEAELLESLRTSLKDFKKGKTKKIPDEWVE